MEKPFARQGVKVGIFFSLLFVICFAWFFIRGGSQEIRTLHNNLFVLSFWGWTGFNAVSFFAGLIQSFVWGYIVAALWIFSQLAVKEK